MLRLLLYIIGMGAVFYVGVLYSSEGVLFFFVVGLVYLLLDLFWLISCYRHAGVDFRLLLPAADKGQAVPLELTVTNSGRLPVGKEKVVLYYRSLNKNRRQKLAFPVYAGAGKRNCFTNRLTGMCCGSYCFEQAELVLYDPLRMLYIRKKIHLKERLDIMPDIYPTGIVVSEAVRHFAGESDIYDSIRPGNDASEPFEIREFRNGDKLKDIHWKLSAKEDTWVVRENSSPVACAVVLLIDMHRQKHAAEKDALLSLAAGVSFALVEQRCPHYVSWYSGREQDMVRVRVDSEEGLYVFLMHLFMESERTKELDLREEYRQRYKGESYLATICVTPELSVYVGDEKLCQCRQEQLEQDMGEMLICV